MIGIEKEQVAKLLEKDESMLFSQTSKATSRAMAEAGDMRKKKKKQDNRMARTFVDHVINSTQNELDRSLLA